MRTPDISARDARALLSVRDDSLFTADGINRRRFLQMVGLGVGGGALLGNITPGLLPGDWREAFAAGPLGTNQGVLVIVGLYGGNDGLNTVVPYSNGKYHDYRANIAVPTNQLHILNNDFGLHPNLTYLKSLWDQQKVAIVQGLGYSDPDLSHFNSMAYWMSGFPGGAPSSGWIGRWLDGIGSAADLYSAATIGTSLPLHLVGQTRKGTAIPVNGFDFGGGTDPSDERMYAGIKGFSAASAGRGPWHDAIAGASRGQIDLAQTVAPIFAQDLPGDDLVPSLTVAARLINADLGFRVIDVSLDGFDNHDDELADHPGLMQAFDDGLKAFFETLSPQFANRVTVMTFSEFGRTPWSNDSGGTDHGTAAPQFVIGGNVIGGLYGQAPSLYNPDGSAFEEWDRLNHTMDFRSLYATVIDGVLGGGSSTVLNGSFETIPLFRKPLNDPASPINIPSAGPGNSDLVSIVPVRLLDTRLDGGAPMGATAIRTLPVAGTHGVPASAVAAVLNVTAVGATGPGYLTVWPTGVARPGTSSLNMLGGDTVPNLVITKLGNGSVDIYNNAFDVHCVVDIVGYFQSETASRFTSLAPSRILDSRIGLGAAAAPVGQDHSIDLQVAGRGGVDGDADTVVLNVTVTEPTGEGFITVWPTGTSMPTASNLNFVPHQTVPNLVVAKLGDGGRISLYNSSGDSHLIADVLGCFRAGVGARMMSIAPVRLLDTRTDGGASSPVGQTPLRLPVVNRGGVPGSGVTAVVLNVTATEGNSDTYITVYPSGQDAPTASNLNVVAGQTRANLVIAKVGGDGAVALYNNSGSVHLIADVVGYFTS